MLFAVAGRVSCIQGTNDSDEWSRLAKRSTSKPNDGMIRHVLRLRWSKRCAKIQNHLGMCTYSAEFYAREKVSHALRSRPNDERRRKTKPRIKTARKPEIPPELEGRVQALIHEQQALLKSMIEKEVFPGTHFDSVDGVKSLV